MTRGKRRSLSTTMRRAALIALALGSLLYLLLYASTTWRPYTVWLAAWSLTAVAFYGWDKWQARRRGWRVPEAVLLALALMGGFAGAWAGMPAFGRSWCWLRYCTPSWYPPGCSEGPRLTRRAR